MQEKANELAKPYLLDEKNESIYVTFPDHAVYLNSDFERIKCHCEEHNLTVVVVKDSKKVEEKQPEQEDPKPKKGKK